MGAVSVIGGAVGLASLGFGITGFSINAEAALLLSLGIFTKIARQLGDPLTKALLISAPTSLTRWLVDDFSLE